MKITNRIIALALCTSFLYPLQFSFRNNICHAETQRYMGEVNADGVLTSADALLILLNVISSAELSDEQKAIADSDNDGIITSNDALTVLQCTVGLSEPQVYEPDNQENDLSAESVYNAMIALKEDYPEGMTWTNDNFYEWNGGIFSGGFGCAGFAFMLSDAAFGTLPARTHENISDIKVGDILRVNNDSHSVIVLEVNDTGVVLAEGNYNSSIHWGRTLSWSQLESQLNYVMTRYPQ